VSEGGLQKRLGRVGAWPGNVRSWARPRRRARAVRGGVPTDEARGTERAGERTGSRADERGLWDSERRPVCAEETDADRSAPPGSERERAREVALRGRVEREMSLTIYYNLFWCLTTIKNHMD
jgi:hypothetical protein